jgi:hypothetical protein
MTDQHPAVTFLLDTVNRPPVPMELAGLLAGHPPIGYSGPMGLRCRTCKGGEPILAGCLTIETPQPWPCRTVLGLAKTWGWEA